VELAVLTVLHVAKHNLRLVDDVSWMNREADQSAKRRGPRKAEMRPKWGSDLVRRLSLRAVAMDLPSRQFRWRRPSFWAVFLTDWAP
jgi:hypothetical protein